MPAARVALAVFSALTLLACGTPEAPVPDAGPVGGLIGPEGGQVEGDGVVLSVPQGALTDQVQFRIVVSDIGAPEVPDRVRISKVFQIQPEKTRFAVPATVRLSYLPDRIPEGVPASSADVRRTDFTRAQERLNSILVNMEAVTVAGETTALGTFWSTVPAGPRPANIKVTPALQVVFEGAKVNYTAEVRDQNDRVMAGKKVIWSTSNPKVATINADGEATAVGPGSTDVIARAASAEGKAQLQVASTTPFPKGFDWESPRPQGNDLYAVGGDASTVYFGGANGTLIQRTATASTRLATSPLTTLFGVTVRGTEVLATGLRGDKGLLLRYDGAKLTEQTFIDAQPSAIYADQNLGMAVGEGPQVVLRDPATGSWSAIPSPTTEPLLTVDGATGELIVVGTRGAVYKRAMGAWVALSTTPLPQIQKGAALHGAEAFAISDKVVRKFASGVWNVETLPAFVSLTFDAIAFAGDALLIVGHDLAGTTSIVVNDGTGYVLRGLPGRERIHAVWGRSATDFYAVGDAGAIQHFDGAAFTSLRTGSTGDVKKIVAFSGATFAAVNDCANATCSQKTGAVLSRQPDGTWTNMSAGFVSAVTALGGAAPTNLWAGGSGGYVYHYSGGSAWSRTLPGIGELFDIQYCNGTTYAAGAGKIFADAGGSFTAIIDFGQPVPLRAIGCYASGFFVVGDGAIVQITGVTATVLDPTKDNLSPAVFKAVWATSDGQAFIGGDARFILHWNGSKFEAFDQPANVNVLAINGLWGTGLGDVYAVGTAIGPVGVVLHFNGAFWTVIDAGTSTPLRAVAGVKAGELWIGGDGGALLFGKAK